MIGIIAAMDAEVQAIQACMQVKETKKNHTIDCIYGTLEGQDVVVCKSGVGKGLAAMATTILCMSESIDAIINVGVAGGLKEDQNVMDLVISNHVVQADYDTSCIDGEDGLGLIFESDHHLQEICIQAAKTCDITYHVGDVASQDLFMARPEDFDALMNRFPNSICSEMEAGAIAQIAHTFNIPFLVIRSLSDVVCHDENPMEFSQYVILASQQAAKLMQAFCQKYQ